MRQVGIFLSVFLFSAIAYGQTQTAYNPAKDSKYTLGQGSTVNFDLNFRMGTDGVRMFIGTETCNGVGTQGVVVGTGTGAPQIHITYGAGSTTVNFKNVNLAVDGSPIVSDQYILASGGAGTNTTLSDATLTGTTSVTGNVSVNSRTLSPAEQSYVDGLTDFLTTLLAAKQDSLGSNYVSSLSDDSQGTSTGSVRIGVSGDLTLSYSEGKWIFGELGSATPKADVRYNGDNIVNSATFFDFHDPLVAATDTTGVDVNFDAQYFATGNDPYTKLLLHFDETGSPTTFLDSSEQEFTISGVGNAHGTNTQSVFGGRCLALDGSGDRLSIADHSRLEFLDSDLEINFRMRLTNTTAPYLIAKEQTAVSDYMLLSYSAVDERFDFIQKSASTTVVSASSGSATVSLNTWYDVTVVRKRDKFRFYLNGVQQGSDAVDTDAFVNNTGAITIGGIPSDTNGLAGFIDELRITIGCGRKMSNFTIPDEAYGTFTPQFSF